MFRRRHSMDSGITAVREANDSPLTLQELQKDIWKSVEGMTKRSIMKEIESLDTSSTCQNRFNIIWPLFTLQ